MVNMAIVVVAITILAVISIWILMFSPKLRAKMMERQMKSMKYMMDENEEVLTDISKKSANISKEGIRIKANALKEGLTGNQVYCKYCGESIDEDSVFCKNCGKEQ